MNILITGATGYLGSRLTSALLADGRHRLTVMLRERSDPARLGTCLPRVNVVRLERLDFNTLLHDEDIGLILHCATNYGRTPGSRADIVSANLLLPLQLLDAAATTGRRLAFINTDTMLDRRISAYTLSKKQFKDWLQLYSDTVIGINVALEHFFGPGDDPTKFVSSITNDLRRNAESIPLTPGEQERDFIYIDDAISALARIVEFGVTADPGFHEFEIGSGQSMRLREFVELAKAISGNTSTRLDFGALPYRMHEVMRIVADTSRIRALGWSPKYSVREALEHMIRENGT